MTSTRTSRPWAFLAATALAGAVALSACGTHPAAAPTTVSSTTPAVAAPATTPAGAALPTGTGGAAQTAQIQQDLAGISSQLNAAGQDLQNQTTQQSLDPRG